MLSERNKLLKIMSKNYVNASKKDKGLILDSLVLIAGYSRKYASCLMHKSEKTVKLNGSGLTLKADPCKKITRRRDKIMERMISVTQNRRIELLSVNMLVMLGMIHQMN